MHFKNAALAGGLGLLLGACAQTPNATIGMALESRQAVIISPLLATGSAIWKNTARPEVEFQLDSENDAKLRIGAAYQMVVVEPGTYRLNASTAYTGQGRANPRLVSQQLPGRLGQVMLMNGSYREPYVVKQWQDRVTQRVVIPTTTYCASTGRYGDCLQWGYNQGGVIDQVIQQEGYRNQTRYKDPVNTLTIAMRYDAKLPIARLEVKAGEVLLINAFQPTLSDIGYDDQNCTPDDELKNTYVCPFNRLRMGIPYINLDFFKEQARTDPPIEPALLAKVKPYYVQLHGTEVGRNKDQWPVMEFAPTLESPANSTAPHTPRPKAKTATPPVR